MMSDRLPGAPRPTGDLDDEGLAITTPAAKIVEIAIDDIDVPEMMRPIDEETVERIVDSIRAIGIQAQGVISIEWNPSDSARRASLVAGCHRLEAFRRLGWAMVPAAIFDGTSAEAELWRIGENLCRKELSALERAEQIAHGLSFVPTETRASCAGFGRTRASRRHQRRSR